jgi:hypothetical protein
VEAPDVLRRISYLLLRLFTIRGLKESLGLFHLSGDAFTEDDNDVLLISDNAYSYGVFIIANQVTKTRKLNKLQQSAEISYDDFWSKREPNAVCAMFNNDMRLCFSAARACGVEKGREDMLLVVERATPVFDRCS